MHGFLLLGTINVLFNTFFLTFQHHLQLWDVLLPSIHIIVCNEIVIWLKQRIHYQHEITCIHRNIYKLEYIYEITGTRKNIYHKNSSQTRLYLCCVTGLVENCHPYLQHFEHKLTQFNFSFGNKAPYLFTYMVVWKHLQKT